ncbi:MAG: hypothetical protein GXO31_00195 [Epsilonproteobacteria bacterium]|nr:hypothetical protein [Campylobacterota bacterium]
MRIAALLIFLFFSEAVFAGGVFKTIESKIIEADDKGAVLEDSPYVPIGSSGVVIRKFDDKHSTIIAGAVVEKKEGDKMRIKFIMFDMLEQSALPPLKIMPKKGDTVILNYLYNRAFVIAPNEDTYLEILSDFPQIDWIHPDILAAFLSKEYNPTPKKEDFQKVCKQNTSMLLFFAIEDKGYFVDCNSFKILKEENIQAKEANATLPFYSRIKDIESSIFNFGPDSIKNYDKYYKKLLGIEK